MIDRRTFVAGVALVPLVPALEWLPPQLSAGAPGDVVIFAIDGWSDRDNGESADQLWIQIGPSWRANWR
jgi:hypothetical protein